MNNKVKLQTGFPLFLVMMAFIALVSHGEVNKMMAGTTKLNWFKEWYMYFEVQYGKSLGRWFDASNKYCISCDTCRKVYENKLQKVLMVRAEWPRYVTMVNDCTYRKEDKWTAYKGKRVVFFDNTNIPMKQPANAGAQQCTYSIYYGGNLGKGLSSSKHAVG
jgi:hypothetical protein